ncbi:MAG: replication restart helicase PriA [Alkalispirochaetaceae bacterium]
MSDRVPSQPEQRSPALEGGPAPAPYVEVAFNLPVKQTFTYRQLADSPAEVGMRVTAEFGRRVLAGAVVATRIEPPPGVRELKAVSKVIDSAPIFGDAELTLARWLSQLYLCSLGEALGVMLPGARQERALPDAEIAEALPRPAGFDLSEEQSRAVEAICAERACRSYLYGITGSGKTEVFIRVAEATVAEGRGVIYLVPEIALTHQLIESLSARFPGSVAVLHSGLTPSRRLSEWQRLRRGEARVALGARSAVFAPVDNLGLIIVDEEHEGSYKAGNAPRYHARQVAMKRCSDSAARLLLGSATPSLEAWHHMAEGTLQEFRLTRRLSGGHLPRTTVVDLKLEEGLLSKRLLTSIEETVSRGRQGILFMNRRGFSSFFHCRSCGYEMNCERCSATMTYHKSRGRAVCHYCGWETSPVSVCPDCGSLDVGYAGFGTERVEEEVARLLPSLRLARVDSDSTRKKGSLQEIFRAFYAGELDLLLGTQMVSKGLNFPGVQLVGIVVADTGLNMPDFRSAERTFAQILQVAGRAGRFAPEGEVIIQSYKPESKAVRLAAAGDLERFYREELAARRELSFPPFSRLIRLIIRGRSRELVRQTAASLASDLEQRLDEPRRRLFGPAPCVLERVNRNYREHILLQGKELASVHRPLRATLEAVAIPASLHLEIDVDPVALL